jgi:hypothetical protein
MLRCSDCGERSPDNASFCILCGARLSSRLPLSAARAGLALKPAPLAAAPARRKSAAQTAIPLLGLMFASVFVIGIAQVLAISGMSEGFLLAGVLSGGALLAECAWVNGDIWRGLRGMLLWGGLTWLLAAGQLIPWALALLLGWALLHPRLYAWRA